MDASEANAIYKSSVPVTEGMLHRPIYARLKDLARRELVVTYSEIAPLASLDMDNPDHRDQMGEVLGIISTYEHEAGRPLLSAIVIHRDDNIPGTGFFELARELGLLKPGQDKIVFWCREVMRVHDPWKS